MSVVPPGTQPFTANPFAPGTQPVTLGGIAFWTQEAPTDFKIGGVEQKLAVTELVGGGRTVQSLGAQPKPFTFRGKFLADRVASQIPALKQLCVVGNQVSLTYGPEQWNVVVKDVEPTYRNQWWAEYDITIEPVSASNGQLQGGAPATQDQQIGQQSSQAAGLNSGITTIDPQGSAGFQQSFTDLQTALASSGPLSRMTSAQTQALLNTATTCLQQVNAYVATLDQTTQQYSLGSQLANALSLIRKNIAAGQTQRSITVQGGNCFALASKYYGDVDQFSAIMEANGLASPFLPSTTPSTLVLPILAQVA
jgi:hypothetical protein